MIECSTFDEKIRLFSTRIIQYTSILDPTMVVIVMTLFGLIIVTIIEPIHS